MKLALLAPSCTVCATGRHSYIVISQALTLVHTSDALRLTASSSDSLSNSNGVISSIKILFSSRKGGLLT